MSKSRYSKSVIEENPNEEDALNDSSQAYKLAMQKIKSQNAASGSGKIFRQSKYYSAASGGPKDIHDVPDVDNESDREYWDQHGNYEDRFEIGDDVMDLMDQEEEIGKDARLMSIATAKV